MILFLFLHNYLLTYLIYLSIYHRQFIYILLFLLQFVSIYRYISMFISIGLMSSVFANGPGGWGSILG